ncbi:helix-hairpin-helix domain-containing protein [Endothiovibrio diazotrophicus]
MARTSGTGPGRAFLEIPGVGKSIAQDLVDLGYQRLDELKGEDPEAMYQRLMELRGSHVDRCMLYVFRCAVYYAAEAEHDPELLKWWNWKDERLRDGG